VHRLLRPPMHCLSFVLAAGATPLVLPLRYKWRNRPVAAPNAPPTESPFARDTLVGRTWRASRRITAPPAKTLFGVGLAHARSDAFAARAGEPWRRRNAGRDPDSSLRATVTQSSFACLTRYRHGADSVARFVSRSDARIEQQYRLSA
jgi:hypothetical protein